MFENLDEVRSSWKESEFIHITINLGSINFLALPSQATRPDHFELLRDCGIGDTFVALPFDFFREISLPTRFIVYKSLASRYPVVSKLINNNQNPHSYKEISLSVDSIKTEMNNSDESKAATVQKIGEMADDFSNNYLRGEKLVNEFSNSFVSPGHINLIRGHYGLLKRRQSFVELALALTDICNQAPSVLLAEFEFVKNGLDLKQIQERTKPNLKSITDRTILSLWRSIKKIDKSEFIHD